MASVGVVDQFGSSTRPCEALLLFSSIFNFVIVIELDHSVMQCRHSLLSDIDASNKYRGSPIDLNQMYHQYQIEVYAAGQDKMCVKFSIGHLVASFLRSTKHISCVVRKPLSDILIF